MRWCDLPFVAFDMETTGLNPLTGDRIIEVGLFSFRLDASGKIVSSDEFSQLVQPEIPLSRTVMQLTGIKEEDLRGKPVFADIAEEVGARFRGAVAVAHNYPFDHAFVVQELARAGVPWHEPLAAIDTVDVSRRVYPEARSHKLGELVKRAGVKLTDAHRAIHDARATAEALSAMIQRARVDPDLPGLLAWSGGLGPPPESSWLGLDGEGWPIFRQGPHEGDRVQNHPYHLSWMTLARVHQDGAWAWRFDEATRAWAEHFLRIRSMGREHPSLKGGKPSGWSMDSCIAAPRPRA